MMNLKNLENLLSQIDYVEGHTENGRLFKITYNSPTLTQLHSSRYKLQIFENGCVAEPLLPMGSVLKNNFLSVVNRIDSLFFSKRITKVERKKIHIIGSQDNNPLTLDVDVTNTGFRGTMFYQMESQRLEIKRNIPDHIPANQRHHWLYLHLLKPESWEESLKYNIKDRFYNCCGSSIHGTWNYCHYCGKKQEVNGLKIDKIVGEELLTLLI